MPDDDAPKPKMPTPADLAGPGGGGSGGLARGAASSPGGMGGAGGGALYGQGGRLNPGTGPFGGLDEGTRRRLRLDIVHAATNIVRPFITGDFDANMELDAEKIIVVAASIAAFVEGN